MLKGSVFKELPDLDDKYTVDERKRFVDSKNIALISLTERWQSYVSDMKIIRSYEKSFEKATEESASRQRMPDAGFIQGFLDWSGNRLRAFTSGRTALAQAIFEHNTALALSIIESDEFEESMKTTHFQVSVLQCEILEIPLINYAVLNNEIEVVRALIKKRPHLINAKTISLNGQSISALQLAIMLSYEYGFDRQAIALALIEEGADLESTFDDKTAVFLAQGLRRIALALYRKGANMNALYQGMNVLQYLLSEGQQTVAIALINQGAASGFIQSGNRFLNNLSILQYAKSKNYRGVVLALVQQGAKDDCAVNEDRVLLWAIREGEATIALAILKQTSQFSGEYGHLLLHTAISNKCTIVAMALCEQVDINGYYQFGSILFYHFESAMVFDSELAIYLLNQERVMPLDKVHRLHQAIRYQLPIVVSCLLEKGADAEQRYLNDSCLDQSAQNALEAAVKAFDLEFSMARREPREDNLARVATSAEVVAVIYKHYRRANISALYKNKPLIHHAIFENWDKLAVYLIESDVAEIEAVDDEMTPLHHAIRTNRTDVALALIPKGANLNALFKNMTPLHHAIRENNAAVALALIAKDPDLNNHSKYRERTVLEHALAVQELDYQYKLKINSSEICLDNAIVAELKKLLPISNAMAVDANPIESEVRASRKMKIG